MGRSQLKQLIKECIVEVLQEGLGSVSAPYGAYMSEGKGPSRQLEPTRVAAPRKTEVPRSALAQVPTIAPVIKGLAGGNSVLESIIADTASTTLVEQMDDPLANVGSDGGVNVAAARAAFSNPNFSEEALRDPDPSELDPQAMAWSAILDKMS